MKTVKIELDSNVDTEEFVKVIGFISESISGYKMKNNMLMVDIEDSVNEEDISIAVQNLAAKYVSARLIEKNIYQNRKEIEHYYNEFKSIYYFDEGMASLSGVSLFLFRYFENVFESKVKEIFEKMNCNLVTKLFPVMLPISCYKKTGYLKRSPQYAIFCCSAIENLDLLNNINEFDEKEYKEFVNYPLYALSPSACFHVYEEYKNKVLDKNTVVTFTQSVFRNEGRFNFAQFGRMRDYHVREIVFIGDEDFVSLSREQMLDITKSFIDEIDLDAKIQIASDPFILPKMQKFKKIQTIDKSKYELQISYEKGKYISVASFNLHGNAFTHSFEFSVKDKETVTGCIGYGLERFVFAFLSQYGEDYENWPKPIKQEYILKNGE
ncbi:MAG: hypothetical protein HFI34_05970 [Lachnospiraceae bacterium]|nr:hypothetical protein [Lachnospiraceae bacterium]